MRRSDIHGSDATSRDILASRRALDPVRETACLAAHWLVLRESQSWNGAALL